MKQEKINSMTFDELAIEMIVLTWYPIKYYKINLGRQDQLTAIVHKLQTAFPEELQDDIKEKDLRTFLAEKKDNNKTVQKLLKDLTRYVPYRFIRPWFPQLTRIKDHEINKRILQEQASKKVNSPYLINAEERKITINKSWQDWFHQNIGLIDSFTLLQLTIYLEKNNPNLSNISSRIFRPKSRNLSVPTKLWKNYIDHHKNQRSVFSNLKLVEIQNLSIDHYLPWRFVVHDELWNLHPVDKTTNSAKGAKIPTAKNHKHLGKLQFDFSRHLIKQEHIRVEDYYRFFACSKDDFVRMNKAGFVTHLKNRIEPKVETALNMGFEVWG